ncbi:MAG: methyltransferase [Pseudomonadota bacterium]
MLLSPSACPATASARSTSHRFSPRSSHRLRLLTLLTALGIAACSPPESTEPEASAEVPAAEAATGMEEAGPAMGEPVEEAMDAAMESAGVAGAAALAAVLEAQPEDVQARLVYRHPAETMAFFGIEPGMTVLEALPGGGWYTKILAAYLGTDGTVVGVDYDKSMFPLFGFMSDEQLAAKETWPQDWSATARGWFEVPVAGIDAAQFGAMPAEAVGTLDAALFIRALHNMARFEDQGGYLTTAVSEVYTALKPGGVLGVVQHMAPEDAPDEWASGANGYLKKSFVIAALTDAGFELVDESPINENPKDQPTTDDRVWRLPPTLSGAKDNPDLAAERTAIGESTRMTLKFRKPA